MATILSGPSVILRPSLRSTVRLTGKRLPRRDLSRYTLIRSFFTQQASISPRPPSSRPSTIQYLAQRRWNSHQPSSSKEDCPHCSPEDSSLSPIRSPATFSHPSSPFLSDSKTKSHSSNFSNDSWPVDPKYATRRDHAQNYTPFVQRLISRTSLPLSNVHRPSKEELLSAATSWWERLRIRVKWFTIRGWRKFNTDDLSAFFSFIVVGNSKLLSTSISI